MRYTIDNIKRTLNFGFFIILCLTVFSPFNTFSQTSTLQFTEEEKAWISSHPVLNVGNERFWPPMDFAIEGEAIGYSIDLMNLIAKELGIEINYVNGLSWSELLEALNNGRIDVLPAISKTDEREAYIKFTKSYLKLPYVKVINGALQNSKLENKTIAVFEGSNVEGALINEYPNINLIYLNTVEEALRKVSTGEVDVFIENLAVVTYYLNESYVPNIKLNSDNLTFLNSPDVYIGVLKKNEILGNLIDKGLEAVTKEDVSLLKNKWLPVEYQKPEIPEAEELLTYEERQWVSHQATLKVANEMDLPPFNFSDNGVPNGYSVDLIKLISEKIDLPIEFVDGFTWAEIIEKFKRGELDILPFVHFTEERNEFMSFTESYESNHSVLVVNQQNTTIKTLDDPTFKKIAIISNYATAEILKNKYPNIEHVFVNNITEALTEVSLGNVDGFVGTLGTLSYILDQSFIPNIKIVGVVKLKNKEEIQIHIAVAKDSILFRDILQKGLNALSVEEINTIRQKWIPTNTNSDKEESFFKTSYLWKNVGGILILFIIFYFGFKWVFKRFINEKVALEFGSRKFRLKTNFYLTVLVVFIAAMGWLATIYIKGEFTDNIKLQLENDLGSANGRLEFWVKEHKDYLKSLGHNQKLVELTNDLKEANGKYNKENYKTHPNKLSQFLKEYNYQGSYIIDEKGFNIGSVDTSLVGNLNKIVGNHSELMSQAFNGEVVFIPPLLSEIENPENPAVENSSLMYFLIPIEDIEDKVIAALIQEIDPAFGFSEILQLSHVGETGESYIFNRKGRMLSKSRFEKDLKTLGIYQLNNTGTPYIEIRDPEGNLTTGYIPKKSIKEQPLTIMAKSAIEGNSDVNIVGYNDYRGVPVMGAWMWIDELELGLATEIDVEEALNLFYFIRLSALLVLGITLLIIIGSILFTLTLGEKANVALIKAKDELEERVLLRTTELNNEKSLLTSLINAIPDLIFFKDTNFKFLGANAAFENQIGFKKESFIGKTDSAFIPEELAKEFQKSDAVIIEKSESVSMESEDIGPDGNKIVFDTKKSPFYNEAGKLLGLIGVSRDITIKKKADEEILKRTQELNDERVFLSTLINSIPDLIFYKDINDNYLGANESFLNQIGLKINALKGRSDFDLLPLKKAKEFKKIDNEILKSLKPFISEVEEKDPEGNILIFETRKTPFFNKKGDLLGLIGISRDITERKKAELRVKSQSAALKSTANGVVITNTKGKIVWVNPALRKLTGYSWDELIGNNPSILNSGKHDKAFFNDLWDTISSGETWHGEIINKKKDGTLFHEEMTITPILDDKDKIIQFVAIKNDITERKIAEEEIRASENKFRSITSTATDAIISADKGGNIESWNSAAEKIFGHTEKEALGQKLEIIIPDKHHKGHKLGMERVLGGGEKRVIGRVVELEGQHKNGRIFPIELALSLFEGKEGLSFSGIIRDITDRKELEEVLLKAKKRMEDELNVAKDIQMSMLPLIFPAFPKREEIEIYAELIPAREVGGDFYDFHFIDENHLCLVMADVSGKGVPAALMMAVTKTLLKSRASNDKSTASILTDVNNEIAKDNDTYMFITVFIAILNINTGEFVYSNAGHNPSYIISKENKKLTKLGDLHGPVIGAMEGMTYGETKHILKKNDIIFSYTDGVTESHNSKAELYSDPRLEELLQKGDYNSTEALVKLVVNSVKEFEGEADQFDDITVMAIKYCLNPNIDSSIISSIKIINDLKQIAIAIEWFEAFAMENKMPFAITQKINIAFDELLNNIISYGYNDDDVHEIDIEIELRGERLIIITSDDGIPFNPFKKDPPDTMLTVEERMIGGLGIHLVKKLMDEYEYKRQTNKNIITLIKHNINI